MPVDHLLSFKNYSRRPGGSALKNPLANAGDVGSVPGPGRSPGEGNGNPLQYSCLGNPMDRAAWRATVHRVSKSQTRLNHYHPSPEDPIGLYSVALFGFCLFNNKQKS